MREIDNVAGQNGSGAGYSNAKVDESTGVSGVRPAYEGYDAEDGTYVHKGSLAKKTPIKLNPVNTGNELLDRVYAMRNDDMVNSLMDPQRRAAMAAMQDGVSNDPTRAGMDYYMMSEYGNSNLDTNPNVVTSEQAKFHRDSEESFFRPIANGLARMGVKYVTSMALTPRVVFDNVVELFGGTPKYGTKWLLDLQDNGIEYINRELPQYDTQAEEEEATLHPIKYMFTTGGGVANLLDNAGYSIGSAHAMGVAGHAAIPVTAGLAALNASTAVKKAIWNEHSEDNEWWQNATPAMAAALAAIGTSILPKGLQNGVKVLTSSVLAASSEAEMETQMAVKEYIREKTEAIDASISARKSEVAERYTKQIEELAAKYNFALPGEKERIAQELNDLKVAMENELTALDWQRTKAVNQAVKDSDSTASITRLANYAILTGSNAVQFGKFLTGGFKRYATETSVKALDEAMDYAGKRYSKAQSEAGVNVFKRAQNRWNKDRIIQEGLNEFSEKTGKKVLDEGKTLSVSEYALLSLKHPIAEGWEELSQSMASNAGKAYAERNTDDYYGQISGLDAFRRSESALSAAISSLGDTLGSEQAWSEFLAGTVMGAVGIPSLRNPKFKRMTGERDANGNLVETTHWRSPIYFQGGVYGEIRKAQFDRANRGKMAEEINKYLSPEGRKNWQRRMANMAHHMQYQEDKEQIVGMSNGKDKFHWENAEDADLVKTVELFQQTGQMDLLKAFARTELDYETVDELRDLQQRTMTVDKNGDKVGRYTEFDLTDPGENASEAQKKHLNDEMARMKDKIETDVNRRLEAIDLYADARRKLQQESQQGLTAEAMNVLAWYGTRIGLFDKRTNSMYNEHEGGLNTLNGAMEGFFKERHAEINTKLAEISKARGAASLTEEQKQKLDAEERQLFATREMLTLAEEEWTERWSRASKVDSPLGRAKVLFTGNEEADPIGGAPAKKPWYLPDKVWARRINAKQSPAARRRAALMGVSLARRGSEGQLFKGVLDTIIEDLSGDEVSSQALRDAFPDAEARKGFAAALHDMRECQAAIVRYKDLYQFYKDNPYAAEARAKEASDKFDSMAAQATIQEAIERLRKCETVKAMYEEVVKMVKEDYDTDFLNGAIKSLAKEGSEVAKSFLANQDFLQVFCAAVDSIAPLSERGSAVGSKLGHVVLKEIAIEAAAECDSVETMHTYIEKKLGEVLASPEAFAAFVYDKGIVDTTAMTKEDFAKSMATASARVVLNKDGQFVNELQGADGTEMTQDRMKALRSAMPLMLNAVDDIIKEKLWAKRTYSFGEHVDWPETNAIAVNVAKAQAAEAEAKHAAFQAKLAEIGGGTYDPVSGETVKAVPDSDVRGEQQPEAPLDGDSALDNGHEETADEANKEMIEESVKAQEPEGGRPRHWIPALSFFNMKFRKLGKLVRNKFILIKDGRDVKVEDPAQGSFSKFWNVLEKLGVWDFVDGTPNGSKDALRKGEDIYFVVDKVDPSTGKSRIFGLAADEVAFNGTPVVFMCVKRGDKFQCVGTMPTSRAKLERDGQLAAWESIVTAASQTEGAYVHGVTGRVAGVHQGLVETQDGENTLDKVCGGAKNVILAINTGHTDESNEYPVAVSSKDVRRYHMGDIGDMKKQAVVHVLVKDNATGKYIPMPCRIAHFSKEDEARLGKTGTWQDVLSAINNIAQAVTGATDIAAANKALTPAYVALGKRLATQGYGVHINVIKNSRGRLMLSVSKPRYSDGHAIELKDENGETMYQVDKDNNPILDEEGNKIPLKERIFSNIPLDGSADVAAWLRDTLMSDDYSMPFRVSATMIQGMKEGDSDHTQKLITDGIITANIVDGGGAHTRGCYVQVEYGRTEEREVDPGLKKKESGVDKVKMIGESVLKTEGDKVSLNGRALEGQERALATQLIGDKVEYKAFPGKAGDYVIVKDELGSYTVYYVNSDHFFKDKQFDYSRTFGDITSEMKAWDDVGDVIDRVYFGLIEMTQREIFDDFVAIANGEKTAFDLDNEILFNSVMRNQYLSAWRTIARLNSFEDVLSGCDAIERFAAEQVAKATQAAQAQEAQQPRQEALPQERETPQQAATQEESREERQEAAPAEQTVPQEESRPAETAEPAGGETVAEEAAATEESSAAETPAEAVEETPAAPRAPQMAEEPVRETAPAAKSQNEGKAAVKTGAKGKKGVKGKGRAEGWDGLNASSTQNVQPGQDNAKYSIVKPGEATAPRVDVAKEVAALRKVVPWLTRDEAIMIVDRLMTVAGKGTVAQGAFKSGLMIISTKGVRGTVFHEAFHSIFRTALDEKTRKAMIEDAKKAYGVTRAAEAEECLADAFRDFMVDQVYERSWTRRIRDFFDWLLNLLDFSGTERYLTINRVFRQINAGAYADAGRNKFSDVSLRELRIAEYRMLGYPEDQIRFLERQRGSFSTRSQDVRNMIIEAGYSEESFDALSQKDRDEVVACL